MSGIVYRQCKICRTSWVKDYGFEYGHYSGGYEKTEPEMTTCKRCEQEKEFQTTVVDLLQKILLLLQDT